MPRYDIECPAGHQHEVFEDREVLERSCPRCGGPARRVMLPGHTPFANGFTAKPTREHYVNVDRAFNAQHELIRQAEREHVQLPDFWKIAKDRVARGDAVEIT